MSEAQVVITKDMVSLLDDSEKDNQFIAVAATTFAQDVWRRFRRNKIAVFGLFCVVIIALFAIFGPMICEYTYDGVDLTAINQTPTGKHWFGTDSLGRDLFVRVLYGARISLTVGVAATIINLIVGSIYGGISGFCGGKIDMVMMRIVDIIYSIPTLLYVILVMMFLGSTLKSVIIAIVISSWAGMARTVRAEVLKLKEQEFAVAAKVIGAGNSRILLKHLLTNLVLWKPAMFGVKPEMIIKGGFICASRMGDANASIPTPQPVIYTDMFGAKGLAAANTAITFVSGYAYEHGIKEELGLKKIVKPVRNCRTIGKKDMKHNNRIADIQVDPETYTVTVDGEVVSCEPFAELALARRYYLF